MIPDRPVTRMDWARLRAERHRARWADRPAVILPAPDPQGEGDRPAASKES